MDSALRHVRDLAKEHQGALADAMCAIYCWYYGDAPSMAELYALFGAMKVLFAEEAKDDAESVAPESVVCRVGHQFEAMQ